MVYNHPDRPETEFSSRLRPMNQSCTVTIRGRRALPAMVTGSPDSPFSARSWTHGSSSGARRLVGVHHGEYKGPASRGDTEACGERSSCTASRPPLGKGPIPRVKMQSGSFKDFDDAM